MKLLVVFLAAVVAPALGQMVRQCSCGEIQSCKAQAVSTVLPCADQCQRYVAALGASYPALRRCLVAREPQIKATVACVERKHGDACSRGGGGMVPKRYPETLKIAAMSEINSMLGRMGIAGQVKGLLAQGKKAFGCIKKCMEKKADCAKKLGCGLSLPSDSVMVQEAKQCAISSGFNTQEVQQICQCAVNAGLKQLAGVCGKIRIS